MVEPRRAAVRPRIVSPFSGETVLLADAIEDLLAAGRTGWACVEGETGWGRKGALRHLAAVLGTRPRLRLSQLPPSSGEEPPTDALGVFAARQTPSGLGDSVLCFRLAPWGIDEALEYLQVRHPEAVSRILASLQTCDDVDDLGGCPLLWRTALDAVASSPVTSSPTDALRRRLHLEAGRLASADETAAWHLRRWTRGDGPHAPLPPADLPRLLRTLEGGRLWVEEYVRGLLERSDHDTLARLPPAPRPLVERLARRLAADAALRDRLECALDDLDEEGDLPARLYATLLTRADPAWLQRRAARGALALRHDLSHALLEGLRAPGLDLRGLRLKCADLTGADLLGADLCGSDLTGAVLRKVDLTAAQLRGVRARGADFEGACLQNADVDTAELQGARLTRANLRQARIRRADLEGADLQHAALDGADLLGTRLSGAQARGARLRGAHLEGASLDGADLRDAEVADVSLVGAVLRGARLDALDLSDVDLTGADLAEAWLTGASLRRARLTEADLRGARLALADLSAADLRLADLEDALFHLGSSRSGLVFSPIAGEGSRTGFYTEDDQNLESHSIAEVRKANLRGADLRGAQVFRTDFYLVDLRAARYDALQGEHFRRSRAFLGETVGAPPTPSKCGKLDARVRMQFALDWILENYDGLRAALYRMPAARPEVVLERTTPRGRGAPTLPSIDAERVRIAIQDRAPVHNQEILLPPAPKWWRRLCGQQEVYLCIEPLRLLGMPGALYLETRRPLETGARPLNGAFLDAFFP